MSWTLASALVLALALGGGFWWFERSRPPARMLALVATLAALCGLGRVAFAALPSVKPTTAMVLVCGLALGAAPGFAIGALAALSSNFFLGQGPWTPWQMAAWGAVGVAGAALGHVGAPGRHRIALATAASLCALVFSEVMNLSMVSFSGGPVLSQWTLWAARGIPFDVTHVVASFLFAAAFGPELLHSLERFRTRLQFSWAAVQPPAAGAAVLVLVGALALAQPSAARAAGPAGYLLAAQNGDGGFGAAPGQPSSPLFSAWSALGLAAAGHNPADVARGGRSALDAVRSQAARLSATNDLERTLLVLRAAGVGPTIAGRNLLDVLAARQRGNGSIAGLVNLTAFGVYALRGFGRGGAAAAGARWIARQQDSDGGFNFAGRGSVSDVDDTGAALEALAAGSDAGAHTVARALAFLHSNQNSDGGFSADSGGSSNAQSTAFAVQGLVAVGRDPARFTRAGASPLGYLRSLIAPNGSVRYSRSSGQTPVWVTGQALLAPVPRAPRAAGATAATATGSASARRGGRRVRPGAGAGTAAGMLALAWRVGVVTGYVVTDVLGSPAR